MGVVCQRGNGGFGASDRPIAVSYPIHDRYLETVRKRLDQVLVAQFGGPIQCPGSNA